MLAMIHGDRNMILPQRYLVDLSNRSMTRVAYETTLHLGADQMLQWSWTAAKDGTVAVSSRNLVEGGSTVVWTIATKDSEVLAEVAPDGAHALVCADVTSDGWKDGRCRVVSRRHGELGDVAVQPEALGVAHWVVYDKQFRSPQW